MADQVKLTDKSGALSVDLTSAKGVNVTRVISNPLIIITIPADPDNPTTEGGAEPIDLKMLSDRITLSFKLTDGVRYHGMENSSYATAETTYTDYEKLVVLTKFDLDKKKLYVGEYASPLWVVIENFTAPLKAGGKDFMEGCSLTLSVVNADSS
jgi:hypothetical protein